jgi:Tfp pilus assembly protein PilV
LTLIEMLVTIAVIAVGVLGIAGGIAIAEKSAGIAQGQAKLEVAMRQISDYVRADCYAPSDPNCRLGLLYKPCAQTAGSKRYTLPTNPAGLTWSIIAINESRSATRNGSSLPKPNGSSSCGGNVYDWGVQEITLKVSSTGRSLTRTIWKADT